MTNKMVFDDARKTGESVSDWINRINKIHFETQLNNDPKVDWGTGLHALIISDRCPRRSGNLYMYLIEKTDLSSITLLHTLQEAQDYMNELIPDFLIFVGMPNNKSNYQIQDLVLRSNPFALVVMYAFLDCVIECECVHHHIQYAYSSNNRISGFIEYLREEYAVHVQEIKIKIEFQKEKECKEQSKKIILPQSKSLWQRLKEKTSLVR